VEGTKSRKKGKREKPQTSGGPLPPFLQASGAEGKERKYENLGGLGKRATGKRANVVVVVFDRRGSKKEGKNRLAPDGDEASVRHTSG